VCPAIIRKLYRYGGRTGREKMLQMDGMRGTRGILERMESVIRLQVDNGGKVNSILSPGRPQILVGPRKVGP
jgi:hypothetical protein